jgi:hypothetical protein
MKRSLAVQKMSEKMAKSSWIELESSSTKTTPDWLDFGWKS